MQSQLVYLVYVYSYHFFCNCRSLYIFNALTLYFLKLDHIILNTAVEWKSLGQFQWIVAASCVKRLGYMVWNPLNEYNKIESCTIQAFWGSTGLFLSVFSTYPRHFSGSLEYWHQQPTFAKQKLHYQWKPYSDAAKVSICQQRHACQFAIRQWVDSGAFCLRMFTRMDSIGQIRICSNHIIISCILFHSQPLGWIVLSNSVSLWRWLLEAMEENFSKNKQSSLNALMVLKSIVTTFAWNSKKNLLVIGHQFLKVFDILYFG